LKRALLALLAAVVVLAAAVVVRAWRFRPEPRPAGAPAPSAVDPAPVAEHLAAAIRFRTVSSEGGGVEASAFSALRGWLESTYPAVHGTLVREIVNDHALLYTWRGSDASLAPALVMGHQDVVPVETESGWAYPPFAGQIAEGHVWGRGALDDKGSVVALMEAAERLASGGFTPRRTLYMAFGHDEEIGGEAGAAAIARLLAARGVRLESVLDEGELVTHGVVPGVAAPVALIGIAQKGYLTVELEVSGTGGHSSMPPSETTVGILAGAVKRIQDRPLPARPEYMWRFLDVVGREMSFARRLAVANRWLFAPLLERQLARVPTTNAGLRTTTAATVFQGGVKANILPARARALINFRVIPGDTMAGVLEHARRAANDPRIAFRVLEAHEPTRASRTDSPAYSRLRAAVYRAFPEAVVAPALVLGGTDSRRFEPISADVYEFAPLPARPEDLARLHGKDERVAVAALGPAVAFYLDYLRETGR
jgi:carboxypeptidase PM20D1